MKHYATFDALMQLAVLPLHKEHPDWKRLDGNESDGNRTTFATFRYMYKTWKIHSDTQVGKLMHAWKIVEAGEKPFQIAQTKKGTSCLHLAGELEDDADGLYIYVEE